MKTYLLMMGAALCAEAFVYTVLGSGANRRLSATVSIGLFVIFVLTYFARLSAKHFD